MLIKKLNLLNYDLIATNQGINKNLPIWSNRNISGKSEA